MELGHCVQSVLRLLGCFFKVYNIRTCEPLAFEVGTACSTERYTLIPIDKLLSRVVCCC